MSNKQDFIDLNSNVYYILPKRFKNLLNNDKSTDLFGYEYAQIWIDFHIICNDQNLDVHLYNVYVNLIKLIDT
jgi:hypothetical protein